MPLYILVGDFIIHSTTRTIMQNTSAAGVKVFGYLFTDPDSVAIPDLLTPNLAPGSVGGVFEFSFLYLAFLHIFLFFLFCISMNSPTHCRDILRVQHSCKQDANCNRS